MLFDPLDRILGSVTKVRLLRVLLRLTEPLSGREAQSRAGLKSRSGVSVALNELSDLGVLRRVEIRGSNLYGINHDHDLTGALSDLFVREEGRLAAVTAAIRTALVQATATEQVVSVILYGSNARREASPESDLDLLVVVKADEDEPAVKDAFLALGPDLRSKHGLRISPYVLSARKASGRESAGDPFIRAVRNEGRVLLGEPLDGMAAAW